MPKHKIDKRVKTGMGRKWVVDRDVAEDGEAPIVTSGCGAASGVGAACGMGSGGGVGLEALSEASAEGPGLGGALPRTFSPAGTHPCGVSTKGGLVMGLLLSFLPFTGLVAPLHRKHQGFERA